MSVLGRCEQCEAPEPAWRVTRRGDAATAWACAAHLSDVAAGLQRDWEITELVVTSSPKAIEWAQLRRALAAVR